MTWTADWIWRPTPATRPNTQTSFRTVVEVEDPQGFDLHITAHLRYRLWVNGRLLADGPPPSLPEAGYYDSHDLSGWLSSGANCLAVTVRWTGTEPGRRPGLLAELIGPAGVLTATGRDAWRCREAVEWSSDTATSPLNSFDPYQEIFDSRLEPIGWRLPAFDDADWESAVTLARGASRSPLHQDSLTARPIPAMEEQSIRPVRVSVEECLGLATRHRHDLSIALSQAGRELSTARVSGADHFVSGDGPVVMSTSDLHLDGRNIDGIHEPCVLLDLGRQETAFLEFDVEGHAGATIDVGFAERLVDGRFNNAIEGQFAARYILREGRQLWRTTAWRGFRYIRLRVRNTTDPLTFHDLTAVRTRYPFASVGAFHCADARLDRIFEMCRDTVRLCCHDSIMDTPWREQGQWLGDISAVTAPAIRTLFGDTALIEKYLRQSASTVHDQGTLAVMSNVAADPATRPDRDIPDYTLWWVIDLLEHHSYTGEDALIAELFPVARQILDGITARFLTPHGTLRSFGWTFIDWADLDRDGENATLNALLYGALRTGAQLAPMVGESTVGQRWTTLADRLREVFDERFWDADAHAYIDAVGPDGDRSVKISEHANFAAIRFGLITGERAGRLADRILDDPSVTEAQPFFTSVVLDALHLIGRTERAVEVIEHRWGRRMLDRGATSCYEEWSTDGSRRSGEFVGFMRTESHAWSAHPATFLIKSLAGIEILEPGCRRISVTPSTVLDFRSVFPTPYGAVTVTVEGGQVAVSAPPQVEIVSDHRR